MVNSFKYKIFDFNADVMGILKLFADEPHLFFLDSSLVNPSLGRYSLIGFDPFDIYQVKGKNIFDDLRSRFLNYSKVYQQGLSNLPIPFCAGAVGFFCYDLGFQLENIKQKNRDELHIPDCYLGFYDCVIAVDHLAHKLYVVSTGLPETHQGLSEKRTKDRLQYIIEKLSKYSKDHDVFSLKNEPLAYGRELDSMLSCNFCKQDYIEVVKKALKYIRRGDIYQVNLAQRYLFDAKIHDIEVHPIDLYSSLRRFSPSCFGGYFDGGNFQILSSSPERFLKLERDRVSTRPMKGTRRRGIDLTEDMRLKKELLESQKEQAELLMITDLLRNDLGRVCEYGSIKVGNLRALEEYQTVFQTTSTIEGRLQNQKDAFHLLEACFPGGSVTGCPKIRAMEIIEELEPSRRSFYTGSLGYIDFSGNMDFNILIRSMLVKKDKIYFNVGSGIVSDSSPEDEYEETLIKSMALRQAIARHTLLKTEV